MKRNKTLTLADIADEKHLERSILLACRGKGDRKDIQKLKDTAKLRAKNMSRMLKDGTYRIRDYHEFELVERGKARHIQHVYLINPHEENIPPDELISDGGLLRAIVEKIEPDVLQYLTENTHAAIKYHGMHLALKQLRSYMKADPAGTRYCYKIDAKKYFPSIDRAILKRGFRRLWADKGLLRLLDHVVDSAPGDRGIPIGNHTSQIFANIYFSPFDHWVQNKLLVHYYIRYMDDIIILAGDKNTLRAYHREIEWYLARNLNLEIKPNWQIFPVADRGVDFIGYRTWHNKVIVRRATQKRMYRACRLVRHHILVFDLFSDHDRSVISSYAGIIGHCTPKARNTLYDLCIKPNLDLIPPKDRPCIRWKEHMHKSRSGKRTRRSKEAAHTPASTRTSEMSPPVKNAHHPKATKISHSSAQTCLMKFGMHQEHQSTMLHLQKQEPQPPHMSSHSPCSRR